MYAYEHVHMYTFIFTFIWKVWVHTGDFDSNPRPWGLFSLFICYISKSEKSGSHFP